MRRQIRLCFGITVLALASIAPAVADVYTIALVNGASFETRYQPIADSDSPDQIAFLSDTGNWVSIPANLVQGISVDSGSRGFGRVIDTDTIEIGMSLNDLPAPDDSGAAPPPTDSAAALLQYFKQQDQRDFTVPQFVTTEQAGGGIPLNFVNTTTPPIGVGQQYAPPH
jgi:hypothetical protein